MTKENQITEQYTLTKSECRFSKIEVSKILSEDSRDAVKIEWTVEQVNPLYSDNLDRNITVRGGVAIVLMSQIPKLISLLHGHLTAAKPVSEV